MSEAGDGADTPAEQRLGEHLALLRAQGPAPGRSLVRRIVRSARWQRAIRPALRVVGMIAASVLDGLGALVGRSRRSSR